MQTKPLFGALLCAVVLSVMSACGGSDGGSINPPPPPPPTGGIDRLGIAIGPISTFGSVVVNGVRYDTSAATFTVNDVAATQADLRVGDVVAIVGGTIDANGTTGTADAVVFDDLVKGPVESIDPVASQLVVLGQTVFVRPDTTFDDSFVPASLEGVSVGQIVEVSGLFDANGNIAATRIEPKPAGTQFEVHGTVSALDAAAMTFSLNALVVDFSAATLDNFPGGQISDGDFVEAKGLALGAAGELVATQVELEVGFSGNIADGDLGEIEGFITRFVDATDFDVSGFAVATTASTVFEGGVAADLGLNIKVEVKGVFDAAGILVATKVDIRPSKAVRVTANADSIDVANNSLVILGITVNVDERTRLEDKSSADIDPLTLADVNAGDYLEIRGDEFPAGSGTILATIFEREDTDPDAILQGFVETITDPSFTILAVTIDTNAATVFRDENDVVISAADFFNQVAPNSLVKAKGLEATATSITAIEVEFELEL
jgi:hypothetical protein